MDAEALSVQVTRRQQYLEIHASSTESRSRQWGYQNIFVDLLIGQMTSRTEIVLVFLLADIVRQLVWELTAVFGLCSIILMPPVAC